MHYADSMNEKLRYKNTSWFFPDENAKQRWEQTCFNPQKYWGDFPKETQSDAVPDWALVGFDKYGPPVVSPTKDKWDCGVFGGGVHNGAVIVKDGLFYYIYRAEFPIVPNNPYGIRYACNIGVAVSADGIHFEKKYDFSPVFNDAEDQKYSYEDVCVVEHNAMYYMFVNRWNWNNIYDTKECGVFLAVSNDLLHWEKKGIVFSGTEFMCRNACVLQNPFNQAVQADGWFRMYMSTMQYCLLARSKDLVHWEVKKSDKRWPGGECCFALTDYDEKNSDSIILFTGGHHSGHFYAIGEVLFQKKNPSEFIDFLKRPILYAETKYPWEYGLSAETGLPISYFRDTVFFNGLTKYNGNWYLYYGGSEYYTCLAVKKNG